MPKLCQREKCTMFNVTLTQSNCHKTQSIQSWFHSLMSEELTVLIGKSWNDSHVYFASDHFTSDSCTTDIHFSLRMHVWKAHQFSYLSPQNTHVALNRSSVRLKLVYIGISVTIGKTGNGYQYFSYPELVTDSSFGQSLSSVSVSGCKFVKIFLSNIA